MERVQKKYKWIIITARVLFVILFLSSFLDKVFRYDNFLHQLFLSPMIPQGKITYIAFSTLLFEGTLIVFLVYEKTSKWGLLLSSFLLSVFGFYLFFLLHFFKETKPCGCGFLLSKLTYEQHIVFNFLFCAIAFVGYALYPASEKVRKVNLEIPVSA